MTTSKAACIAEDPTFSVALKFYFVSDTVFFVYTYISMLMNKCHYYNN